MFSDLTRALASIGHRYLPYGAASAVAYWFGAAPASVARAIPRMCRERGHNVSDFFGHKFNRSYHIRLAQPQICPLCLAEFGRARASWDISLVTCCPQHLCALIDYCPGCGKALCWRRPGLFFCLCGFDLRQAAVPTTSTDELWLSAQIESLLLGGLACCHTVRGGAHNAFGVKPGYAVTPCSRARDIHAG